MTSYNLETGKTLLQHVDVVGVSCKINLCKDNPVDPPWTLVTVFVLLVELPAMKED